LLVPAAAGAKLSASLEDELRQATYVYIASTRKDGSLSQPAEIWFLYHDGAVYVGTRPTSWRVRRIQWKRPRAKIWVGKRDGPAFMAAGEVVKDPAAEQLMLETFAKKYPEGWAKHAESFREGFKDRSRVLVRYTPE
jgi:hypothetical protein